MTDWLSDTIARMKGLAFDCGHKEHNLLDDAMRMARVIRELVAVVCNLEAGPDGTVYFSANKVAEALRALSHDAKDLIEQ